MEYFNSNFLMALQINMADDWKWQKTYVFVHVMEYYHKSFGWKGEKISCEMSFYEISQCSADSFRTNYHFLWAKTEKIFSWKQGLNLAVFLGQTFHIHIPLKLARHVTYYSLPSNCLTTNDSRMIPRGAKYYCMSTPWPHVQTFRQALTFEWQVKLVRAYFIKTFTV